MTMFSRDDWTLFRNINTLGQKAGVPRDRLAALVLKELVDNALDAGAKVTAEELDGAFLISDDGPGIPGTDEEVAGLFSIRRPLTSTKLYRLPTRGALGNGLRVVAGSVLASGGALRVRTGGRWLRLTPLDDGSTGVENEGPANPIGTSVEVSFGSGLETAGGLSMATLAIRMRGESRYEGPSSPHWYDSDAFYELLQASRDTPVFDIATALGVSTDKLLAATLDAGLVSTVYATSAASIQREVAEKVLSVFRFGTKPPKPAKLGVVGESVFANHGYAKKIGALTTTPARGGYKGDVPVVVEAWAVKLDKSDSPEARIFVNRTPITARVNCGMRGGGKGEMWITGCGLNHYFPCGRTPMQVTLCVTAPYMPITTDGKEPNLQPIFDLVTEAIKSATRKAKLATSAGRQESKASMIGSVLGDAINKASDYRAHRFSLRQLFYATREMLQDRGVTEEPDYGYFGAVIGQIEQDTGRDIPGMYRDARGQLYHPHTGETIALGTLNVEKYHRPEYRFNKVLYVEKGGFFPLLIDEKWAERHDCALLTSQGFASRAARDVIDLLGDSDEPLEFFCVHDADGPGTLIYEALVEGTLARPGRRVKVTNLGLEPWEAEGMGLQSEKVDRKRGAVPVADYIRDAAYLRSKGNRNWETWLQTGRFELNAMSSSVFLRWLDEKMERFSRNTKVIPPRAVLADRFKAHAHAVIREQLIAKAIRDLGIEAHAQELADCVETPMGLSMDVERALFESPNPWEAPLNEMASAAARTALGRPE